MNEDSLDLENLLNDDSFINWVLYNRDSFVWENFVRTNPARKDTVEKARQVVLELHRAEEFMEDETGENRLWSRIRSTIESEKADALPVVKPVIRSGRLILFACAVILMGIIFGMWQYHPSRETISYKELVTHAEKGKVLEERINAGATPLEVILPDGSAVTLSRKSKLSFPRDFIKNKREVFLSGEAFFNVKKDASRPFYVYANETVTRVLGTSFQISAFENEKSVTVDVRTGRVSVYRQSRIQTNDPETTGIVLLPNQKVTFNRDNESLIKNLVEIPVPILPLPANDKRRFEEVPVTEIFKEMEKVYGVKILYDQELLSHCIVSTSLRNNPLYDNLEVICKTIGGSYKEIDAQIVIESHGCQ